MTTPSPHHAVRDYLDDLRDAARQLPAGRRRELLAEIEAEEASER